MGYRLKDDGYPFMKIMSGRKWVGRVYKVADGTWSADINRQTYSSGHATAKEAFYEGCSKRLGYVDHSHLRENNRQVRRMRKHQRAEALRRFMGDNPDLTNLLGSLYRR